MSRIIVVDDDVMILMMVKRFLSQSHEVSTCQDAEALLSMLEQMEELPDLILLDYQMPEINGVEVLKILKEKGFFPAIPIMMITGERDVELEIKCFNEGVSDFITKPFIPDVLVTRIRHVLDQRELQDDLKTQVQDAMMQASQDSMTGLYNRGYSKERIERYLEDHTCGAFALIDMDNFKYLNDVFGHVTGDEAICLVAKILKDVTAGNGIAFRLGGDEFGMFIYDSNETSVIETQVMDIFAAYNNLASEHEFLVSSSLSLGIALAPEAGTTYEKLYESADKALYSAKRNGKNGYAFYTTDFSDSRDNRAQVVDIRQLKQLIEDKEELRQQSGVYRVDYREFQRIYNFLERCVGRQAQSANLVLISLIKKDKAIKSANFGREMYFLEEAVKKSLRRNDVSTKYSASQILLVLVDVKGEDGMKIVSERIKEQYQALSSNPDMEIHFEQMPIV